MADKKQFNTNRPPEIIANQLVHDIENYLFDQDVKVIFGDKGFGLILDFVNQCNSDVEQFYDAAAKSDIENQRLVKENQRLVELNARLAKQVAKLKRTADLDDGFIDFLTQK